MSHFRLFALLLVSMSIICKCHGQRGSAGNDFSKRRLSRPKKEKQQINIGLILPKFRSSERILGHSVFQRYLDSKMNRRTSRHSAPDIRLNGVFDELDSPTTPHYILECLCEKMVKNKVALIVIMASYETYGDATAIMQYLIQMASVTGIPILAWNADNAGLLVDKNFSEYRFLQLAPPIDHQVDAMFQLLERYNWHKFTVVTTAIGGAKQFIQVVKKKALKASADQDGAGKFNFEILQIMEMRETNPQKQEQSYHEMLSTLVGGETRIILLYATEPEADRIFKIAKKLKLTRSQYMWIVTQSAIKNKAKPRPSYPIGTLGIHFNTESNPEKEAVNALAHQIRNGLQLLGKALDSLRKEYATLNETLPLVSNSSCKHGENPFWDDGKHLYKALKSSTGNGYLTADYDDQPRPDYKLQFRKDGRMKYSMLDIYNLKKDRAWNKIGFYSGGNLEIEDITWPGDRMEPPRGTPDKFHLRVTALDEKPFVIVGPLDENNQCTSNRGHKCLWEDDDSMLVKSKLLLHTTESIAAELSNSAIKATNGSRSSNANATSTYRCCSGFCIDLLKKLSDDVGFTFDISRVSDGLWGIKNKTTDEWNGLVAEILNDKADIIVTSFKINSERMEAVDITVPWLKTGLAIIVALRRGALSPTAFLEPFDFHTWILILLVSIQTAAVAIFLFEWLSPQSYDMKKEPPTDHKFSLFRVYWLVWATLFSASVSTDVPRSHTARFMALVWAAFSLMFYAVYTANLAAFMITRTAFHDLTGINDARLQPGVSPPPTLRYGTIRSGNTEATIRENYPLMHKYIKAENLSTSYPNWKGGFRNTVAEGVKSVKRDELDAFIYDAMALEYLAAKDDNCEILTVGEWSGMTGYGFGLAKNSKYLEIINQKLLEYREKGYLERLESYWFSGACSQNSHNKKTHSVPLGVENFMSAFILLAGGTIVCLLILCLEYIYCNFLRLYLKKIDKSGWCGLISLSMARSLSFSKIAENLIAKKSISSKNENYFYHQWMAAERRIKELENMQQSRIPSTGESDNENGVRKRYHGGNVYIPVKKTEVEKESAC